MFGMDIAGDEAFQADAYRVEVVGGVCVEAMEGVFAIQRRVLVMERALRRWSEGRVDGAEKCGYWDEGGGGSETHSGCA